MIVAKKRNNSRDKSLPNCPPMHANSAMETRHIHKFCPVDDAGQKLLEMVVDKLGMSARSYSRILKVARTIADLAGEENIQRGHLAEAIQYRGLDRKLG